MKKSSGLVKVYGRVKPWVKDADNPDLLMIVTAESSRYEVDPNRAGADLDDYVGEWIEATGVVRREDGSSHIVVHSFRIVDEESWDDEDDDDW